MTATEEPPPRSRRRWWLLGGLALLLVVLAGGGIWWFLRDDAPEAVDLETAVEVAEGADGGGDQGPSTPAPSTAGAAGGIEGSWLVDTSIGSFDFESADGTFVGFRVEEELSSIGSTTAVGRTGGVTGSITIEEDALVAAEVEADLTGITTNESRRDDRVQSALETDTFPTATFVLSESVELGEAAAAGEPVAVDAVGDLTIHGVTRTVTIALEAQLVDDVVAVVGSTDVLLSDYGVEAPSAPIVVSVSDTATVEFQLLLTRAA